MRSRSRTESSASTEGASPCRAATLAAKAAGTGSGGGGELSLVAYSTPEVVYQEIIPSIGDAYPYPVKALFIYMGYILSESGIAEDLYRMFHVWFGPVRMQPGKPQGVGTWLDGTPIFTLVDDSELEFGAAVPPSGNAWSDTPPAGADAPAQLARCRALLATDDREADDLYLRALALHDGSGGDFERFKANLASVAGASTATAKAQVAAQQQVAVGLRHRLDTVRRRVPALPIAGEPAASPHAAGDLECRGLLRLAAQFEVGQCCVVTRRHVATLLDLTDQEGAAVIKAAREVAQALLATFKPLGILTFQNNGVYSGQEVPHYHFQARNLKVVRGQIMVARPGRSKVEPSWLAEKVKVALVLSV